MIIIVVKNNTFITSRLPSVLHSRKMRCCKKRKITNNLFVRGIRLVYVFQLVYENTAYIIIIIIIERPRDNGKKKRKY